MASGRNKGRKSIFSSLFKMGSTRKKSGSGPHGPSVDYSAPKVKTKAPSEPQGRKIQSSPVGSSPLSPPKRKDGGVAAGMSTPPSVPAPPAAPGYAMEVRGPGFENKGRDRPSPKTKSGRDQSPAPRKKSSSSPSSSPKPKARSVPSDTQYAGKSSSDGPMPKPRPKKSQTAAKPSAPKKKKAKGRYKGVSSSNTQFARAGRER